MTEMSDRAKQHRRQTFDHQVAILRQLFGKLECDAIADPRQVAARLVDIPHRDRSQRKPGNSGLEPPRHVQADRAKPSQSHPKGFSRHVSFPPLAGTVQSVSILSVCMRGAGFVQHTGLSSHATTLPQNA